MLRSIPGRLLRHTVVFNVCKSVDAFSKRKDEGITVHKVCVQYIHETRMTRTNIQVVTNAVIFIDARLSDRVDVILLQQKSEANGGEITATFDGQTFSVATIDKVIDDVGRLHHWEVGCV